LEASVGGKTERTATVPRSCDPVWERGFTFLVSNPETGVLHIKVFCKFFHSNNMRDIRFIVI